MMIIKIEATEAGLHYYETQSHRTECWLEGYVEVPEGIENDVKKCGGYCDLVVENGTLKRLVARPDLIPKKETGIEPTQVERLRADIDFLALMTGVEL